MRVVVTGMGFEGAVGRGVDALRSALRAGRGAFDWLDLPRSGRRVPAALYAGGEESLDGPRQRVLRGRPAAMRASCLAALEALGAARWLDRDCAVVVGGSNLHQGDAAAAYERFLRRPDYVNPRYGASFLDSTVVAAICELGGLGGIGFTVGGGMASGNLALFQGWSLIRSGAARACLCVGAMSDYSELELVAFANMGALACPTLDADPAGASIPFDGDSLGFVYGQAAGAVLLEEAGSAERRGAQPLAEVAGAAVVMDGNAGTAANPRGEAQAMRGALAAAGLSAAEVGYLNSHGTGTPQGDRVECASGFEVLGAGAVVNATKAITGHTLSAAGVVELIATVVQMNDGFVHGNPNLRNPIDDRLRFAPREESAARFDAALSNAFSIGGFNTSIAVRRA